MTVGDYSDNVRGYIDPDLSIWDVTGTVGSLSTGTFTYDGSNCVVGELSYVSAWGTVILITCPGLEGADGSIDLYLDDPDDGDQDHSLTIYSDEMRKYTFSRTLNGAEVSCIEYAWQPKQVDWDVDSKVNVHIVK